MKDERLVSVLRSPRTSEKAFRVADKHRQYVFVVLRNANKFEIKEAVKKLFNVAVKSVTTCHVKGKRKKFKQHEGKRSDWKKAYVTLEEGHEINFMDAE